MDNLIKGKISDLNKPKDKNARYSEIDEFISNFESNFEKQAASISENEDLTKKIAINGTTINYVQMGNGENPTLVFI